MNEVIFRVRIPYQHKFIRRGRRKIESDWFLDDGAISVRDIAPEFAPVAYRIEPGELDSIPLDRPYDVRYFEGSLWWPLLSIEGPIVATRFIELAGKGCAAVLLAIDPSIPVPYREWPLKAFGDFAVRTEANPVTTKDERWAWTRRNALRVIFCGGVVLLEAGEPIAYRTPFLDGYKIVIGHSAMDRREQRFCLPGPNHERRVESAQRGMAFGMGEWESEIARLADFADFLQVRCRVEVLRKCHMAEMAPVLCAHAFVESVLTRAFHNDYHMAALGRSMPDLIDQLEQRDATIDSRREHEIVERIGQSDNVEMEHMFGREIRTAREITRRLRAAGLTLLTREEDEALASLAV